MRCGSVEGRTCAERATCTFCYSKICNFFVYEESFSRRIYSIFCLTSFRSIKKKKVYFIFGPRSNSPGQLSRSISLEGWSPTPDACLSFVSEDTWSVRLCTVEDIWKSRDQVSGFSNCCCNTWLREASTSNFFLDSVSLFYCAIIYKLLNPLLLLLLILRITTIIVKPSNYETDLWLFSQTIHFSARLFSEQQRGFLVSTSTTNINKSSPLCLCSTDEAPAVKSTFRWKSCSFAPRRLLSGASKRPSKERKRARDREKAPAATCTSILCVLHLLLPLPLPPSTAAAAWMSGGVRVNLPQPLRLQLRLTSLSQFKAGWPENTIFNSAAALKIR